MRRTLSFRFLPFLIFFGLCATLAAMQAMPRFNTVTPDTGKAGAEFTAEGEHLEKANVAKLYLTDGKLDIEVQIMLQTGKAIKFKAPADVKEGRFSLMILTTGSAPKLLVQPVKVTIE
ncbi:MAG: hypothetical protein FJW20_27335 [Acidimicrobiia bacterium]|nr:hypothetical protein [Acidimicrobiia bacterium]